MQPPDPSSASDELVFKPVPTQDDMLALAGEANRAKAGRARLFIAVVFLAGIVAAAAIGMSMVKQNAAAISEQAEVEITRLNKQILEKDARLRDQEAVIAAQKTEIASYAPFQGIVGLQQQSRTLEQEIAGLLAEPSRTGAPARLTTLPPQIMWLDNTIAALTARRDRLQQLKQEISAWPPAPVSPRPD